MPFRIEPLDNLLKQLVQLVKQVFARGDAERIPVSVELTDDEAVAPELVEMADAQSDSPVSDETASVESVAEIDDEAAHTISAADASTPPASPQELPQTLADENSVADSALSLETPAATPEPAKKTQQPRPRIDRAVLANAMQKPQRDRKSVV